MHTLSDSLIGLLLTLSTHAQGGYSIVINPQHACARVCSLSKGYSSHLLAKKLTSTPVWEDGGASSHKTESIGESSLSDNNCMCNSYRERAFHRR